MEYVTRRLRALKDLSHSGNFVPSGEGFYCTQIDADFYMTRKLAVIDDVKPVAKIQEPPKAAEPVTPAEPAPVAAEPAAAPQSGPRRRISLGTSAG
jgi:hypothetical protein